MTSGKGGATRTTRSTPTGGGKAYRPKPLSGNKSGGKAARRGVAI
jgi:hypothetical protein